MTEGPTTPDSIPPWKKAACNRIVGAWNDTATDFWQQLTPEGQQELIALEDEFCARMKAIFDKHFVPETT